MRIRKNATSPTLRGLWLGAIVALSGVVIGAPSRANTVPNTSLKTMKNDCYICDEWGPTEKTVFHTLLEGEGDWEPGSYPAHGDSSEGPCIFFHDFTDCNGIQMQLLVLEEEIQQLLKARDGRGLRDLLRRFPLRVTLNANRRAIQLVACDGLTIRSHFHVPSGIMASLE